MNAPPYDPRFNPGNPPPWGRGNVPAPRAPQVFRWQSRGRTVEATVDGTWVRFARMRTGLPIARLRYLYVRPPAPRRGFDQVVLSCTSAVGTLFTARAAADPGQPQFHAFVQTVLALRPDIDIRARTPAEAFRMMFDPVSQVLIPIVLTVAAPALLLLTGASHVQHALDHGQQEVTVDALAQAAPLASRNVTVTDGRALTDHAVRITGTSVFERAVSWDMPLVGPTWQPGMPVAVVLRVADPSQLTAGRVSGILRNGLFEGLGTGARAHFGVWADAPLVDRPRLLDGLATPAGEAKTVAELAATGLFFSVVVLMLFRQWQRRALA